jgi:hypothetical protein
VATADGRTRAAIGENPDFQIAGAELSDRTKAKSGATVLPI